MAVFYLTIYISTSRYVRAAETKQQPPKPPFMLLGPEILIFVSAPTLFFTIFQGNLGIKIVDKEDCDFCDRRERRIKLDCCSQLIGIHCLKISFLKIDED